MRLVVETLASIAGKSTHGIKITCQVEKLSALK